MNSDMLKFLNAEVSGLTMRAQTMVTMNMSTMKGMPTANHCANVTEMPRPPRNPIIMTGRALAIGDATDSIQLPHIVPSKMQLYNESPFLTPIFSHTETARPM
jgi:hypothetical protein